MTPVSAKTPQGGTQQFTASQPVTWIAKCGTITPGGLYTASGSVGTNCTIEGIATGTPKYTVYGYDTILAGTGGGSSATGSYTTFMGSGTHTGANTNETILTPANVNYTAFGLKWSVPLDNVIWSQPLYVNGVTINGTKHNVVYATTALDSVYALDANTGVQLWKRSFLASGVTAPTGAQMASDMNPMGIVGTPVIDASKNTLYVVALTDENNGTTVIHRLHALDITTGADKVAPVSFHASGFTDLKHLQRAGLLLANGKVYVCYASIGDNPPYHGFIFAFDETTLALDNVFDDQLNPDLTGGGGIWMSSAAPSVDSSGNLFVSSGNGPSDGVRNFGQSVIKLNPTLAVLDYFSPYDSVAQSAQDLDLGSGGVLMIPTQSGPYASEAIVCGKPQSFYVLNQDNLGKKGTTTDNVIQRVDGQLSPLAGNWTDAQQPCYSTPSFWNQKVYFAPNHDVMKVFSLSATTGKLSTTPIQAGTFLYSWPGAYPAISSNGTANGIVWTYDYYSGTLRAADANNVSHELFVGILTPGSHWVVPTVINGYVYVNASNTLYAFTLK